MMTRVPFEYALLRVVPRIERGESINAGIIVYCKTQEVLASRSWLDDARLHALAPDLECDSVERALSAASDCALRPDDDLGRRFHWLTAPRSTVVQPGPVHTGLTMDAVAELDRLFARLVLPTT